ncbi:MAG: peptide deformylase [Sandaracinaceae bacterium]|jgi:peptide deformylase|nr:peptide deformylase [Sandaracinaceae bacterium]
MTLRKIAQIGHPVLRTRAREVSREELASPEVQRLVDDLVETMRDANGAGLAAIQIHEPLRIVAIEISGDNPRYPYRPKIPLTILVNPVLEALSEDTFDHDEGCLSVPNLRGRVERHARLRVRAWDRHGHALDFEAHGVSAGVYQHEVDHLDGVVFVDRVADPRTFSTWDNYERHHRDAFVAYAKEIVARYGG